MAGGRPRLSWIVAADRPSARQVAYQVQVAWTAKQLASRGGTVWDSGRVASGASVAMPYSGPGLAPASAYEPVGWREPGFDDGDWLPAEVRAPTADLRPTPVEPVARTLVPPATVELLAPGVWRIDLGRAIVGGLRLAVTGAAGQTVEVRLGEELRPAGPLPAAGRQRLPGDLAAS